MNERTILVVGASGYVGSRFIPVLLDRGYRVRAAGRSLERLRERSWFGHPLLEPVAVDATDRETFREACRGCEAAFYLVHSMEPAQADFARKDRRAAENMAWAGEQAGLERIFYLGGLGEGRENLSHHLKSRAEVQDILQSGRVPLTTLRAAMIVGAGSASFEILRYLVERLPVMITPRWVHTKSQCIAIRDVLAYLVGCLEHPETAGRTFDIGGPDILSYGELMSLYAEEARLTKRLILPVPVLTPKLSSYWIHLVTPIHASLARPLAEGLRNEVICQEQSIRSFVPIEPTPMRQAIREAITVEQYENPRTGENMKPAWLQKGDPSWAGGTVFRDRRIETVKASPREIWEPLRRIGGSNGWYYANWLWRFRGLLDAIAGGDGMRRGRSDPERLRPGGQVDFWRIKDAVEGERLLLEADLKLPGHAFLEFRIRPLDEATCELCLTALFVPHGLLGILYWYAASPFHCFIFPGMLSNIIDAVGKLPPLEPEASPEKHHTAGRSGP